MDKYAVEYSYININQQWKGTNSDTYSTMDELKKAQSSAYSLTPFIWSSELGKIFGRKES
jgi:hypothetical protein